MDTVTAMHGRSYLSIRRTYGKWFPFPKQKGLAPRLDPLSHSVTNADDGALTL